MTTCLDIVNRALRYQGVLKAGQSASGSDASDALQHFQDVVNGLPLLRNGEWSDTYLQSSAAYEATDGERITVAATYAPTITLPATYTNSAGDTVPQLDLSRVLIVGDSDTVSTVGLWVFSASSGAWAQVNSLALSDDSPFGPEDAAGLAALVAISMVDEYGGQVGAPTLARAQAAAAGFRARFYREVIVTADDAYLIGPMMGDRLTVATPSA
jgi:hypothetical protein